MVTLDGEVTKTSWKRRYENYGLSDRKEPAPHGAEGTWCQAGRTASQRASSRSKLSVVQMGMVLRSSHLTLYTLQRGMQLLQVWKAGIGGFKKGRRRIPITFFKMILAAREENRLMGASLKFTLID